MARRILSAVAAIVLCVCANAEQRQIVPAHVRAMVKRQQPLGRLPATNQMRLAIGLRLRNPQVLTNLLRELYQRGSPRFHRYLKPADFTAAFAPTPGDYQSVLDFAKTHGLTVVGTHGNRALVDVRGSVADVEKALHVHMNVYQHPTEHRTFYAPDADPTLDLAVPILAIGGLHNESTPQPRIEGQSGSPPNKNLPSDGTGPYGTYWGSDFRKAYAPGVSLDGSGQTVGLFELDGYQFSDITNYESEIGYAQVPVQNILIDGFDGAGTGDDSEEEVELDIEMAISMAPGLSNVLVYEGSPVSTVANINDLLNRMATDDLAQQISCSWGFDIDLSTEQIFEQLAAQGQSFFVASGDNGAYSGAVEEPTDEPYITSVGGTVLNTGSGGTWASEVVWGLSSYSSGGGISTVYPIPSWQQGVDMSANQGSTTMRNTPDVAMYASFAWIVALDGEQTDRSGTSVAAPLWAGFTALVNQQAALNGQPQVGFLNPALYDIGKSTNYQDCFHDITLGNNTSSSSPNQFFAVPGFDLCSGWGTPNGSNLIAALLAPADALVVSPQSGFTAAGPAGGPFNMASENYTLTNVGTAPLSWSIVNTSLWLTVSSTSGTLAPGVETNVTISISSEATNSPIQDVSGTVVFTDLSDNVTLPLSFNLLSGNGGFETGDFSDWTLVEDTYSDFAVNSDDSEFNFSPIPGINDSLFVHSGLYGAFLGQAGSLATLSQVVPAAPGQLYELSFWLQSFDYNGTNTPNEFLVQWDGGTLFDQTNMPAFGWTNMQFIVAATETNALLEFGLRNDPAAFALDDITLQLVPPPSFQSIAETTNGITLTFPSTPAFTSQVQFTTDLSTGNWSILETPETTVGNVVTVSDVLPTDPQRFYRIVLLPAFTR